MVKRKRKYKWAKRGEHLRYAKACERFEKKLKEDSVATSVFESFKQMQEVIKGE